MVAMYVGTRADNVQESCEIIGRELGSLRDAGITAEELERAKEHVKGRMVLEPGGDRHAGCPASPARSCSTFRCSRSTRCSSASRGSPRSEVTELVTDLYDPERLSAACIGPQEELLQGGERLGQRGAGTRRDPGRASPALRAAWGRPSARRSRAPTTWSWRAVPIPSLEMPLADVLGGQPTWSSTSRRRRRRRKTSASAWTPASTRWSGPAVSTWTSLRDEVDERGRRGARSSWPPTSRSARFS